MTPARFPFLDHPGPIAFAHRGGAAAWPENTMRAFEESVALGYRYIETDARLTADGVLIAFHDEFLDRVTDRRGRVADMTYAELSAARVAGTEPIPRLEDVLGTWPDLRVNIDPKHDSVVSPLVAAVKRTRAIDRIALTAFSDVRLARLRAALGPRLCTGLGPVGTAALRAASYGVPGAGALVRQTGAGCTQIPPVRGRIPLADARYIAAAHRLHVPVHVWTINEPGEMRRLLDLGVDGLMTDDPAVLKEVLVERALWV